ncbi:hypothetical protein FHETE_2811 [Fusarium heterosporum]|uniref:SET domain-containing protein n=1 Tax=Fusarium heterosporum TaxID=42747 RepID=A0A8H5TUN6_FUSHE|nr:hypothetical protein FHETE_2811 [Fusarium heterosporum]
MSDNDEQLPKVPILVSTLVSLNIEDFPVLDPQTGIEARGDEHFNQSDTEEIEITEAVIKDEASSVPASNEELPAHEDRASLDAVSNEYGNTSGSEPDFISDWEYWTDNEEEETTDDFVRSITAHRDQPLENGLITLYTRRRPLDASQLSAYIAVDPAPLPLNPFASTEVIFENGYFAVKRSETAGWGAFAVRELKYGDKILVEKPLFTADSTTLFREFDKLSEPLREIALGLHVNSSCKSGTPQIKAVWTTNCFSTGDGDEAGLFPIASRFNHSCYPKQNVSYYYSDIGNILEMEIRADTVQAGEELTISYGILRTPIDLYFRYGFKCRCGACAGVSEEDLQEIW